MRNDPVDRLHTLALSLGSIAAAMLIEIAPAAAAEQIYSFTDDQGVMHLSNVPADPRYQPAANRPETAQVPPQRSAEADPTPEFVSEPEPLAPAPGERFTPITITPTPPGR